MELMKALGIAKDCLEARAEMWEESIDDSILCSDVLNCFMEVDDLERQAIATEQRQALQAITQFVDSNRSILEDYTRRSLLNGFWQELGGRQ